MPPEHDDRDVGGGMGSRPVVHRLAESEVASDVPADHTPARANTARGGGVPSSSPRFSRVRACARDKEVEDEPRLICGGADAQQLRGRDRRRALGVAPPHSSLCLPRRGETAFAGVHSVATTQTAAPTPAPLRPREGSAAAALHPREADGSRIGAGEVRIGGLAPSPTGASRPAQVGALRPPRRRQRATAVHPAGRGPPSSEPGCEGSRVPVRREVTRS
jgi:hypothetical protein